MKVLFAAGEMFPYVKTGGLADVANALPHALKNYADTSVVLPLYSFLHLEALEEFKTFELTLQQERYTISIYTTFHNDLRVYFIKAPFLSTTKELYGESEGDYPNNDLRFGLFCMAVVELSKILEIQLLHLNDWHTALCALFVKEQNLNIKTVFTIHNLAYQGIFERESCERLGIEYKHFSMDALEFYGKCNFMKAGIAYADALTTVSPSYAQEILEAEFGCGLEGFLNFHKEKLSGILNGINTQVFDPSSDPRLYHPYDQNTLEKKHENKVLFLKHSKLKDPRKPLVVVLSRMVEQKGIDLLIKAIPKLLEEKINLFVMGEGDNELSYKLQQLDLKYPNLEFKNCYDEVLSHQAYASADFLLMPSRFEPCGLAQMIAMHYGTIPIVYATGGLKDTVFEDQDLCGQGLVFKKYTPKDLVAALQRALTLKKDKKSFLAVNVANMECDFSFEAGAHKYMGLYESLL